MTTGSLERSPSSKRAKLIHCRSSALTACLPCSVRSERVSAMNSSAAFWESIQAPHGWAKAKPQDLEKSHAKKYLSWRLPVDENLIGTTTRHFWAPSWNLGSHSLRFRARFTPDAYHFLPRKAPSNNHNLLLGC
jgi:hypothetical protein